MKLTKIKTKRINNVLKKLITHYTGPLWVEKALYKIIEIHNEKKQRSTPQNAMYWALMKWCSMNAPEWLSTMFNVKEFNSEWWHQLCKSKMQVTSTAFDNMSEGEFTEYFNNIQTWLATVIFKCDLKDLMNQAQEER